VDDLRNGLHGTVPVENHGISSAIADCSITKMGPGEGRVHLEITTDEELATHICGMSNCLHGNDLRNVVIVGREVLYLR